MHSFAKNILRRLGIILRGLEAAEKKKSLLKKALVDSTVVLGPNADFRNYQNVPEAILIGPHSLIYGQLQVFPHGGSIRLGSHVFLGSGSRIWSATSIEIGNNVLISHGVNIHDTDSHPLDRRSRQDHTKFILESGNLPNSSYGTISSPVHIADDVWIGFDAVILKGVNIGCGAVVAAAAVVTKDVEPFTLVAGNPAVVRKRLSSL